MDGAMLDHRVAAAPFGGIETGIGRDHQAGRLVPVEAADGAALRALITSGSYYHLDAVLRRRI